jgi:hypothetical protein
MHRDLDIAFRHTHEFFMHQDAQWAMAANSARIDEIVRRPRVAPKHDKEEHSDVVVGR